MDSPPVPLPAVKSPPWHMNPGMTRWNLLPLKCSGLPILPSPFSPVHSALKFSAVLGTPCANSSITTRPAASPPIDTSKNTLGLLERRASLAALSASASLAALAAARASPAARPEPMAAFSAAFTASTFVLAASNASRISLFFGSSFAAASRSALASFNAPNCSEACPRRNSAFTFCSIPSTANTLSQAAFAFVQDSSLR
mmetsp:Transcript_23780/g.39870  ORF Transcript_23780/g.39870 Transcript_23780/m.39870 type:complete len:200 (-) Transcript_23780:302-901(-)